MLDPNGIREDDTQQKELNLGSGGDLQVDRPARNLNQDTSVNSFVKILKGVFGWVRGAAGICQKVLPAVAPVRKVIWRQVRYTGSKIVVDDNLNDHHAQIIDNFAIQFPPN